MKILPLITLVLLCGTAQADDARVRWSVLQSLQRVGMIDNVDVKLAIENAAVEFGQASAVFTARVCEARETYSTDREAFVAAYKEYQEENTRLIHSILATLDARLEATGAKAAIDAKVNQIATQTVDRTSEWSRDIDDPKPIVDLMCAEKEPSE